MKTAYISVVHYSLVSRNQRDLILVFSTFKKILGSSMIGKREECCETFAAHGMHCFLMKTSHS